MGTRLYPKGPEEILAGVTPGTSKLLDALEARQPRFDGPEMDAWYDELFGNVGNVEINVLHNFRMNGYGRISPRLSHYLEHTGFDPICGTTNDPVHIKNILHLQDHERSPLRLVLITEVSWS